MVRYSLLILLLLLESPATPEIEIASPETARVPATRMSGVVSLPVRLVPAADPWQRPWRVRLAADSISSNAKVLAEAMADGSGLAVLEKLEEREEARLEVSDADGRIWLERSLAVYAGQPEVFLEIDVVPVEGRLYFGDERVGGQISFGTTQGVTDIRMVAGEDGKFRGYLPREGRWAVEAVWSADDADVQRLREIEVRRRPGKSYADVEIHIPPTELRGRVVSKGQPARDVGVTVARERSLAEHRPGEPDTFREAILLTDAEGRFRLRGLEPGKLWLDAVRGNEASGKIRLELQQDAWPRELTLELHERTTVGGVVHLGNLPIGGAQVLALASSSDPGLVPEYVEATSDAAGQFELPVASSAERLDLLVAAPSLGVEMLAVRQVEGKWPPLVLSLQNEVGTLRCQLTPGLPGRDFSAGLTFRRNGATLRWMQMLRILTVLDRIELAPGEILLHGLAPGQWETCSEGEGGSCRSGELLAHGELQLASPRAGENHS